MDTIQAGRRVVVTTYNRLALARGGLGRGPQARLRPVSCRIYRHDRQEGSVRSGKANALFGVHQVFRIPRVVSSGSIGLERSVGVGIAEQAGWTQERIMVKRSERS